MTSLAKDNEEMDNIDKFKNDIRFRKKIEHVETIPAKEASYKKVDKLEKKILDYLDEREIKLYKHQALAIEKSREDNNIIITTPILIIITIILFILQLIASLFRIVII